MKPLFNPVTSGAIVGGGVFEKGLAMSSYSSVDRRQQCSSSRIVSLPWKDSFDNRASVCV